MSVNDTRADWPGARVTRGNPASCRGGSPVDGRVADVQLRDVTARPRPGVCDRAETRTSRVPSTDARLIRRPLNANVV